jgi:predicted nucleic acid-binding protein
MMKSRTYLDANVIINALSGDDAVSGAAFSIIDDPERILLVSDYLWLEVRPKMDYHHEVVQAAFVDMIFNAAELIRSDEILIDKAKIIARKYGLSAMDALHAAAAIIGNADELVSFEKLTKPIFRIPADELRVISLYPIQ